MTFASAAWAIDGARIESALARTASYAESGGAEGIISLADLKVSPLAVPGVGLRIAGGGALILNRYQTTINQTYTALNAGETVLGVPDMPPVNASAKSYLVCVTVGDPEFSQVGHPWMTGSDPAPGTEETFQYVRPFIIGTGVTGTTKTFKELGLAYPAIALARLDVPPNTTTITSEMIVDLRKVARPRNHEEMYTAGSSTNNLLNGGGVVGDWENWPVTAAFSVDVPEWAAKAKVHAFVESIIKTKAGAGKLRVLITGAGSTVVTNLNESAPANASDRVGFNIGGEVAIPLAVRGTTVEVRIQGTVNSEASKGFLDTDVSTGSMIRVRFEEAAA